MDEGSHSERALRIYAFLKLKLKLKLTFLFLCALCG